MRERALLALLLFALGAPRPGAWGAELDAALRVRLDAANVDARIAVIARFAGASTALQAAEPDGRAAALRALRQENSARLEALTPWLRARGATDIKALWIVNGVALTADAAAIRNLAANPEIASVYLDRLIPQPAPAAPAPPGPKPRSADPSAEWNIAAVGAPALWSMGHRGQGVVIGLMDTGADPLHQDLAGKWRGGDNSWFDPAGQHATPHDNTDGHGTQVLGLILGGDLGGTAIGMAPGAQWIGAKMFNDAGAAPLSNVHLCFQWFLDPDEDEGTDDAPQIVNGSWGLIENIDECVAEFRPDVSALEAVGIACVFAAGDAGPITTSSLSPANYPESLAIGAVTETLDIEGNSGRGPATCDGRVYPDLVAPGFNVKTADLTFNGLFPDLYAYVAGTSFSAPHAAGALALLKSAFPGATMSQLRAALRESAADLGDTGPDNTYGHGLVDVAAAYERLRPPKPAAWMLH